MQKVETVQEYMKASDGWRGPLDTLARFLELFTDLRFEPLKD